MARRLIALAALSFALTGCVAQEKYNALKLEKDQLVESLNKAQSSEASARAAADAWKNQLDALLAAQGDAGKRAEILSTENAALQAQLAGLNEKYKNALDREPIVIGGPLPEPLSNALTKLANDHPDVVEFDAQRGTVKFKSDVTFARGSAELTSNARSAIGKFASILNSPVARDYEFLVAGHTDSTPVNNPETIRQGHKDNWYLSSHRAISVGRELVSQQVSPRRLGVVGYGDQRPIASNGSADGQAKNRRVEVILLPSTAGARGGSTVAGNETPAPRRANAAPAGRELNKDNASIDARPILNK